jgi:hypothetical protein
MLALAVEHVPLSDAKDHPPGRCHAQDGRRSSSNRRSIIFHLEEHDRSTVCSASVDSMKRVSRPATCFFRRKNNVYRPCDAHRTSGRRCSSTWRKCIGPVYASRLSMGCTTSDDRSSTSTEWTKAFFHVEEVHRTCVRVASLDGVHHARRRIHHVFRTGEDVLPPGRSASDAPTHHGPRWRAPRRRTHRARLPTAEPFLQGACTAMHDRKKQCPRA